MNPSILFLDQSAELGGAELALLDLAEHARVHCTVGLFENGLLRDALEERDVPVAVLPAGRALRAVSKDSALAGPVALAQLGLLARAAARIARRHDVIFCNTQKAFIVGCLAGALARRPVVFYLHDLLSAEHFHTLKRRLVVMLANRFARCVVTNSEATRSMFRLAGGRSPTVVLYNGFRSEQFEGPADPDLRRRLGIGDKPLFGLFGRLARWKGHAVSLAALRQIPGAHLLIVGGALFGENGYRDELERSVVALGLSQRVHFLGFRRDVAPLMKTVDAVLHTSTAAEPFGRVLAEAQLCGRPVIATRGGGVAEIVRDGETGWLVAPGQVPVLVTAMERVIADRELAARVAEAGRSEARRRFGAGAIARAFDHLIAEVA